jgi:intersectin
LFLISFDRGIETTINYSEPEVVVGEVDTTAYNGDDLDNYVALYPYQSAEVGDLTFEAGDMMVVTKKEGEWWTGKIGSRIGLFPSNYVQKSDQQPAASIDSGFAMQPVVEPTVSTL